jgi:branched-chain amino acid transport system permease protein
MTLTFDIVLSGLVLGGMYALIALGLTLQYGVARIMNLSYGEFMIAAAFSALFMFTGMSVNPILGLLVIVPASFAGNWLLYQIVLMPTSLCRCTFSARPWRQTAFWRWALRC